MKRTRIKICGITREADLMAAVEAGADAVGFVFYARSARYVTPERARELSRLLPPFVTATGLFVNASAIEVKRIAGVSGVQLLQFHGDEPPDYCTQFTLPWLKAARISPGFDLLKFASTFHAARGILLDALVEGYGGGGEVFDWSQVGQQCDQNLLARAVLSGGLRPANVAAGIKSLRPFAVDVSSGVESDPKKNKGIKDAALIRQFVAAVRAADAELA